MACWCDFSGAVRHARLPSLTIVATTCDSAYAQSRKYCFRITGLPEQRRRRNCG